MSNKKFTGFYNIVKNESNKETTILIYGVIGGFDWETFKYVNTSNKFVKEFNEIEKVSDIIHIRINSPGGSIYDGMPIYNAIKNSKKTIYTYVDGLAGSMASLIALAGDKVYGYRNSIFMVHNASTMGFGNSSDFKQTATELETYDKALGTIIEDKLGISESEVTEKYLNFKDNYFTGEEALSEGFFDEIIKEAKSDMPEDIANMTHQNMIKYYSKMNFVEEEPITKSKTMSKNYQSIQAALGLEIAFESNNDAGFFLSEEQMDVLENQLANTPTAIENATAPLNQRISELEAVVATAQSTSESITNAISTALQVAEIDGEMNHEQAITALANKVVEYGKLDGAKATIVKDDADDKNIGDNNIVGNFDISDAMNN